MISFLLSYFSFLDINLVRLWESLIKATSAKLKINRDYERMSKPIEYSSMTKDKLMTYTFISILIITVISAVIWSGEKTPSGWT